MTYDMLDAGTMSGRRVNLYHYTDGGAIGVTLEQSSSPHTNECTYPRGFNTRAHMNTGFGNNSVLRPFREGPAGNPIGISQSEFRVSCYMKWFTNVTSDGFVGDSDCFLIGSEEPGDNTFQPDIKVASWGDRLGEEKNNLQIWSSDDDNEGSFQGTFLAGSANGILVEDEWYHMEFVVSGGTLTVYQDGVNVVSAACGGGAMCGFGWQRFGFKGYEFREVAIQIGSGHGRLADHKVTANYPLADFGPNEWELQSSGLPPDSNADALRQIGTSWLTGDSGIELYSIEWCPYVKDILAVSPRVSCKSNDSVNPLTTGAIKLIAYHVPSTTYYFSAPWTVPAYNDIASAEGRHFWNVWSQNPNTSAPWSAEEFYDWRFGFQNTGGIDLYVSEFSVEVLGAASLGYAPNHTQVI